MSEAAMGAYPVSVSVSVAKPDRFERVHLLLRIALWILLAPVLNSGLLLAGPIITAVLVAQKNDASFHERFGETYGKVVGFIVGLQGYMSFASDDFPEWGAGGSLRYDYTPTGEPTVGSALLRIVMVIPQVIALWIVGVLEGVLGFVAVVTVLFSEYSRRRLAEVERQASSGSAAGLAEQAQDVGGVSVVVGRVDATSADALREAGDEVKRQLGSGVVVLGAVPDDRPLFVAMVTPDLAASGLHAGNIIREVAKLAGGGGGGKPHMAQAGGTDASKLDEALSAVAGIVEAQRGG